MKPRVNGVGKSVMQMESRPYLLLVSPGDKSKCSGRLCRGHGDRGDDQRQSNTNLGTSRPWSAPIWVYLFWRVAHLVVLLLVVLKGKPPCCGGSKKRTRPFAAGRAIDAAQAPVAILLLSQFGDDRHTGRACTSRRQRHRKSLGN